MSLQPHSAQTSAGAPQDAGTADKRGTKEVVQICGAPDKGDQYIESELGYVWRTVIAAAGIDKIVTYHEFVSFQEKYNLLPEHPSEDGDDQTFLEDVPTLYIIPSVECRETRVFTTFDNYCKHSLDFEITGNPPGEKSDELRKQIKRVKHFRTAAKSALTEWLTSDQWTESKVWRLSLDWSVSKGHADKHFACRIESFLDQDVLGGSLTEWTDVAWYVKPLTPPCQPSQIYFKRRLSVWSLANAVNEDYRRGPGDHAVTVRSSGFEDSDKNFTVVLRPPPSKTERRSKKPKKRSAFQCLGTGSSRAETS